MSDTPRSDAFLLARPDLMPDGGFLYNLECDLRAFQGRVELEALNKLEATRKKAFAFAAILAETEISKYKRANHCAACAAADAAVTQALRNLTADLRQRAGEYAQWHPGFTDAKMGRFRPW